MSASKIAIRYAKPLLELAEEKDILDKVYEDMSGFLKLCKENREFLLMLQSPVISHLKKAEILSKVFSGKVEELTLSFFDIIARKNRESLLSDIAAAYIRMYNVKKGRQEALVTTSIALDENTRASFKKLVKDLTGKEPLLEEKVDAELIGGYVLRLGDQQIDDSVRGKLNDLKTRFQQENA